MAFRERYDIANRCSTEQAQIAPVDMRENVQSWMRFNRCQTIIREGSHLGSADGRYRCSDPHTEPCVGRFKFSEITNIGQPPLEFLDHQTYDTKGEKTGWLQETPSGWDRGQATLQVRVFADEVKRCKPQLIFKGVEKGHTARTKERALYHKEWTCCLMRRHEQMSRLFSSG